MKDHQLKINNSYESEISSNSGSSSLEESTYENPSFDGSIKKLQEIFKPQFYRADNFNNFDPVCTDKAKCKIRKIADNDINSSQESDFLGFPMDRENVVFFDKVKGRKSEIFGNLVSSSQESDFLGFATDQDNITSAKVVQKGKARIAGNVLYSSQESDFAGFSEGSIAVVDILTEETSPEASHYSCKLGKKYSPEDKLHTSSEGNISSKNTEGMSVFELINPENSCNAVDMKLSNESINTTISNSEKLSFDGTIKINLGKPENEDRPIISEPRKIDFEYEEENSQVYANERSPDLFDDDENENLPNEPATKYIQEHLNESTEDVPVSDVLKKERELLNRILKSLSGIPPPPSVTIMQIDMFSTIAKNKDKILSFCDTLEAEKDETGCEKEIIFKPTHSLGEVKLMTWPDVLNARQHGLCYNLSTVTERIELLGLSVLERYVGAETSSSFQISPSSAKKRNMRMKLLSQSPGSRLSHLARRRAIFSSANLQSNSQKVPTRKITNKQILLDTKKSENRRKQKIITPKRRTPGGRKTARKTPSSSAKKKLLFRIDHSNPAPSRETSKRALFQSPPQQQKVITKPVIKPEIANRVEKSKRALFSPEKPLIKFSNTSNHHSELSSSVNNENVKRRRADDDIQGNSNKMLRMDSVLSTENLTPRSLKIKSQSFCVGSGARGSLDTITGKSLFRTSSDTTFCSNQLSENHKKKLLWAVSQALQSKQISVKHPNFKQHASVLARIVRRLFLENCQKSGSTSDTMLRLAKKYVFYVMQGKTADEIYFQEKARQEQEKLCAPKLTGYIAPEDYENRKALVKKCSQSTLFSENSIDSFSLSQSIGFCNVTQSSQNSEFSSQISQDSVLAKERICTGAIKLPIQPNPSLQNSSSKSNLGGIALRENIDCEQRRSAQKNFTGKDQKNLSPYSEKIRSSAKKYSSNIYDTNPMKAKRQISFDS